MRMILFDLKIGMAGLQANNVGAYRILNESIKTIIMCFNTNRFSLWRVKI